MTTEQEGELDQRRHLFFTQTQSDNEDLDMGAPNTSTTTRMTILSECFVELRWNCGAYLGEGAPLLQRERQTSLGASSSSV